MVERSFANFQIHDRTSKLVTCPKLHVVNVVPGRRFFEKLTGIKNSVVTLKVRMSVDLPADLGAGPIPHKSRTASSGRHDKKARHRIHPVVYVFAPLRDEICGERYAMRQMRL